MGIVLRRKGRARLALVSTDTGELEILADSIEVQNSAGWSPDGKWIVTGGNDATGTGLFKIPVSGGAPVKLVNGNATNPVWSPDNRLIIYSGTNVGVNSPLKGIRPDGSAIALPDIMVLNGGQRFRFTPDGRRLIYMVGDNRTQDFWSLDLATRELRRLSRLSNRGAMRNFDISPDGKQIVFDRIRENSDVVVIDLAAESQGTTKSLQTPE